MSEAIGHWFSTSSTYNFPLILEVGCGKGLDSGLDYVSVRNVDLGLTKMLILDLSKLMVTSTTQPLTQPSSAKSVNSNEVLYTWRRLSVSILIQDLTQDRPELHTYFEECTLVVND